jgi:hypothetical protein
MDRMHRLPARRYSISGMPSSALADYCNLSENAANLLNQSANITNLLNETTKSLSRSSNILNQRCYPTQTSSGYYGHGFGFGYDPPPYTSTSNLPMSSGFRSYPNVNSQMPNFTSSNLAGLSHCLSGYNRPSSDYLLSKPIYSNSYSNTASNYLTQPHSILSQTKNVLSQHFASNPVLSRSLTNLPSSSSPYNHHFTNNNNNNSNISHHYPVEYPPFANDYGTRNYYKRHYSNYQTPTINKLDLDYSRASDFKRQVSFKFDVDELSIDS